MSEHQNQMDGNSDSQYPIDRSRDDRPRGAVDGSMVESYKDKKMTVNENDRTMKTEISKGDANFSMYNNIKKDAYASNKIGPN